MNRATFVALSLVFLGTGIALLIAAGRQFARRRESIAGSALASGTVVGFAERRDGLEPSYFARVKFQTAAGHAITFESGAGSERPSLKEGEPVRVRFRADAPNDAEIDEFFSLWGLVLVLGGLGAVCTAVGAGLLLGWIPA